MRESRVPNSIIHFKCLEEMGFILTADGDNAVKVRVDGYEAIEIDAACNYLDTFCIDRENHSRNWV